VAPAERKVRQGDKSLRFEFKVGDEHYRAKYRVVTFVDLPPMQKIMLALGQFSKFSNNEPEQQQAYLARMLNKNLPETEHLSREDISGLILQGKTAGYIQNGAPCLSFGPQAIEFFFPDRKQTPSLAFQKALSQQIPKESTALIPPETHKSILQALQRRKISYRTAQALAELELRGGEITAKSPHVEIAKNIAGIDGGAFAKVLPTMIDQGLLEISSEHTHGESRVRLTSRGEALIATLKVHPEYIGKEPIGKLAMGTSFRIIEYILDNVGYDELQGSDWLRHNGSELPITEQMAVDINKSYDALVRRIYDLQATKKYLEIQKNNNLEGSNEEIVNIRVTAYGVDYYKKVVEHVRQKEGVLGEDEVWEAEKMLERCVRMARGLGDDLLAQDLLTRQDTEHFFEMSKDKFAQTVAYLKEIQGNLLEAYAVSELPAPQREEASLSSIQ
jgi:predicted metal-dependent hydrolase